MKENARVRIIAGKCRGRRLATAKGQNTRPTGDRVKEAIFSTLGQRLPQARVLDVFAGSGALGLEALSRGAAGAVFLEKDALARQVINKNIQTLALPGAKLYAGAAEQLLPQLKSRGTIDCFELIFLDPPYNRGLLNPMIASAAMAFSSVSVVLNSLRLKWSKF
ncbi:MAG: 16S rRNA (guanine(966)-N(2))-methyltransferase RsmD [Clostridiales bacterium]